LNGLLKHTNIHDSNASHVYLDQSGDVAIGRIPVLNSYFISYIDHI
jgi:hypothetical protein